MLKYEKLVSISCFLPISLHIYRNVFVPKDCFKLLVYASTFIYMYTTAPPTHTHTQPFGICNFVFVANEMVLVQKRCDEVVLEIKDMDILSLYSSSLFRIFES